ncbi:hypothetical protein [Salininema proteolyticum]|uniref:Uncharacterized protein n=1 Tax=Salininema proteolyticum TaxID=1607685 RepID=A0ABV8TXK6_9ACTN
MHSDIKSIREIESRNHQRPGLLQAATVATLLVIGITVTVVVLNPPATPKASMWWAVGINCEVVALVHLLLWRGISYLHRQYAVAADYQLGRRFSSMRHQSDFTAVSRVEQSLAELKQHNATQDLERRQLEKTLDEISGEIQHLREGLALGRFKELESSTEEGDRPIPMFPKQPKE